MGIPYFGAAVLLWFPANVLAVKRLRPSPTTATRSLPLTPPQAAVRSLPRIEPSVLFIGQRIKIRDTRWGIPYFGAADRNRTGTDFTPRDFKSLVSTYSTTAAYS